MNKRFSRILAVCLALTIMVSSVSAFALPADEAECPIPTEAEPFDEIEPRTVKLCMAKTVCLNLYPGSGCMGIVAYKGEVVEDYIDTSNGYSDSFAYVGTELWRCIRVLEGDTPGVYGWVPNSAVTSKDV